MPFIADREDFEKQKDVDHEFHSDASNITNRCMGILAARVMRLESCSGVTLEALAAGHLNIGWPSKGGLAGTTARSCRQSFPKEHFYTAEIGP